MFSNKYCSKNRQMGKNGLAIILLTGWHKNELSVLECAISLSLIVYLSILSGVGLRIQIDSMHKNQSTPKFLCAPVNFR